MSSRERRHLEARSQIRHQSLRASLVEFSKALKAPAEPRAVAKQFTELHGAISDHFAFEEEGGYFEGVLSDAPWLAAEVKILRKQHAVFLQELLELEGLVEPKKKRRSWKDMEVAFRRFRRRIVDHENRENRLIQRAAMRDLGPSD